MTDGTWWLALLSGLVLVWVGLVLALWLARPDELRAGELVRVLPDVVRLLGRLARDPDQPRGVRIRLWLLVGYLAMPIDLVPDVIPVVGQADDVILVVLALRSVVRRAGLAAVRAHWPGTEAGFAALCRVTGLPG